MMTSMLRFMLPIASALSAGANTALNRDTHLPVILSCLMMVGGSQRSGAVTPPSEFVQLQSFRVQS